MGAKYRESTLVRENRLVHMVFGVLGVALSAFGVLTYLLPPFVTVKDVGNVAIGAGATLVITEIYSVSERRRHQALFSAVERVEEKEGKLLDSQSEAKNTASRTAFELGASLEHVYSNWKNLEERARSEKRAKIFDLMQILDVGNYSRPVWEEIRVEAEGRASGRPDVNSAPDETHFWPNELLFHRLTDVLRTKHSDQASWFYFAGWSIESVKAAVKQNIIVETSTGRKVEIKNWNYLVFGLNFIIQSESSKFDLIQEARSLRDPDVAMVNKLIFFAIIKKWFRFYGSGDGLRIKALTGSLPPINRKEFVRAVAVNRYPLLFQDDEIEQRVGGSDPMITNALDLADGSTALRLIPEDLSRALEAIEEALRIDPMNPSALLIYLEIKAGMDKSEDGIRRVAQALANGVDKQALCREASMRLEPDTNGASALVAQYTYEYGISSLDFDPNLELDPTISERMREGLSQFLTEYCSGGRWRKLWPGHRGKQ